MRKPATTTSVAVREQGPRAVRELPLDARDTPARPLPAPGARPAADRIKDALLRWLEEEMP